MWLRKFAFAVVAFAGFIASGSNVYAQNLRANTRYAAPRQLKVERWIESVFKQPTKPNDKANFLLVEGFYPTSNLAKIVEDLDTIFYGRV